MDLNGLGYAHVTAPSGDVSLYNCFGNILAAHFFGCPVIIYLLILQKQIPIRKGVFAISIYFLLSVFFQNAVSN
jgi:hypothetical protein